MLKVKACSSTELPFCSVQIKTNAAVIGYGVVEHMRMDLKLIFIFALSFAEISNEKVDNVKICVVAEPKSKPGHVTKFCDLLARSKKSPVTCVYGVDRLECLRVVSNRNADFTILEPEDLYFSMLWSESAILVVGELREIRDMAFKYGTVVVVRKSVNITGVDLRGRKLCHPGLKNGIKWNDLFAQYLEERLAPRNCEVDKSVFEDRIKTSAEFFGDSCKAGPWIDDKEEDRRLKNQYMSMCAICDMGDCSNDEKYRGSVGSVICLTDGVGDVLWARYDDVNTYFKKFRSDESISPSDYSFLCEDGTTKPLSTSDPCLWLAMPWQVVAANRKSANEVQKIFHQFGGGNSDWEQNLIEVIESYSHTIINLQVPKTPEDFLKDVPGYLSAVEMSQGNCKPKHSVRLCTHTPIEQQKCVWMSKAAASVAIHPELDCVEKANVTDCIRSVANGTSDIAVVPPDHIMDATTRYSLTTLYNELPNQDNDGYRLSAVVRDDSDLKAVWDTRHKNACFTAVGGVGWNTALKVLKDQDWIDSACRGKENLLEFFKNICVTRKDESEGVPLCCAGDTNGSDDAKALECLRRKECDVAFLDEKTIKGAGDESEKKESKEEHFRTICANRNCSWSWAFPNYLMIGSHVTDVKYQEVKNLFSQLGDVFGRKSKNDNKILEIFAPFKETKNVIFKDTSVDFVKTGYWVPTNDYQDVMDDLSLCSASSKTLVQRSLLLLFFVCALVNY